MIAVPVMFADMVEAHHAALKTFASQHDIAAILVEGVPRAFCAGEHSRGTTSVAHLCIHGRTLHARSVAHNAHVL